MFKIICIIILVFIAWKLLKSYRFNTYDTVVSFTGGLGSGKTFMSVDIAIKLLNRNRRKVKWKNRFRSKKNQLPKPMLYSSIPVRISKKEMALELTERHLLLQDKIPQGSVVLLDEIGAFCSQFDFKAKNADIFDEFVRFFRQYTKGGYLVCNDQCSENIVLQVRRRLNTVYNLMGFRKWFWIFYTVKVRNITVSEEIKTVEEQDTEDNMTTKFGIMPLWRRYDTYCYYPRYEYVTDQDNREHIKMTRLSLLRLPKKDMMKLDDRIKFAEEQKEKSQKPLTKSPADDIMNGKTGA